MIQHTWEDEDEIVDSVWETLIDITGTHWLSPLYSVVLGQSVYASRATPQLLYSFYTELWAPSLSTVNRKLCLSLSYLYHLLYSIDLQQNNNCKTCCFLETFMLCNVQSPVSAVWYKPRQNYSDQMINQVGRCKSIIVKHSSKSIILYWIINIIWLIFNDLKLKSYNNS